MSYRRVAFSCCGVFMVLGSCLTTRADTVRLKDGTVVEADIIAEDETQITVVAIFAAGTITTREVIKKKDIAVVIRLTPEQKAKRDMDMAYERLRNYQLDGKTSEPVSYYNQVIDGVFRLFLQQYPSSPYTNEVASKISEWQTERDRVVAGFAKWGGQWMAAAEAARRAEQARAQLHLEQSHQPAAPANQPRPPPPTPSVAEPAALTDVTDWLKRYWIYGAAAVLVGLWLASRLFTQQ